MAWTAPRTWVTGEVVTAALMNTHVRDNTRYLKGLDGDVTFDDDINIGGNKLKTTNLLFKEGDVGTFHARNLADNAYIDIRLLSLFFSNNIAATADTAAIKAGDADGHSLWFQSKDTGAFLQTVAKLVGAADPYFEATLPMRLLPSATPGTLVEGHFWYDATNDRIYFRDASVTVELIGIPSAVRGDIAYRAASKWARLAKGTQGYFLKQGANDPEWAAGTATRDFFVDCIFSTATEGITDKYHTWFMDGVGDDVYFNFKTPDDFSALTHCKVIGFCATTGTIDWTANTEFGALTENKATNTDTATANGVAVTDQILTGIDISAALTGLAADDYVGVEFTLDALTDTLGFYVIGLNFKYT